MEERTILYKDVTEMVGFYCNPEFYWKRKKAESERHVNVQFKEIVARLQAGGDPSKDKEMEL